MKKLGSVIFGFIIGAILTYYFCPRPLGDKPTKGSEYVIPKDTISVAEAKVFSANWEKNNETEIDSTIELEGPRKKMRSVWWSLKEVNQYLAYAKAKSDTLGYKMTGVRIYLGNYGDRKKGPKKNRNTMFIVPTGPKSTSKASSVNMFFPPTDPDIPAPPLNNGNGGDGPYPK
ncbi:hypothetical protein [Algibacter pectinivorans]|uniref:Uncharacterized protein n=1 Tax=Algibacter pectinivorans TaxID=870482 RepID=A0A1I1RYF3_9FLAO|nr:hypothetical protein [Algibacter pectinivorans]SFD35680.1 hypothetical protein SAMN04487987_110121 [Algibacter pectinivorans]